MTKERAALYLWMKDIAPARLFGSGSEAIEKFDEFSRRYMEELDTDPTKQGLYRSFWRSAGTKKTILYASREPLINHAIIIMNYLQKKLADGTEAGQDSRT